MEQFILSYEEHLLSRALNKLINEKLHSFLTGSFNKKEALNWLTKDGLKYITAYLLKHPNNNMTKPFIELYKQNKASSNEWTNCKGIDDQFLSVLDHFKNTLETRIKGGEPEGNATSEEALVYQTWEEAEEALLHNDTESQESQYDDETQESQDENLELEEIIQGYIGEFQEFIVPGSIDGSVDEDGSWNFSAKLEIPKSFHEYLEPDDIEEDINSSSNGGPGAAFHSVHATMDDETQDEFIVSVSGRGGYDI